MQAPPLTDADHRKHAVDRPSLLSRAWRRIYAYADYVLVVRELATFEPRYQKRWTTFDVRLIDAATLQSRSDLHLARHRDWLHARLAQGDVVFAAFRGDQVCGFTGLTFRSYEDGGLRVEPTEDECILIGIEVFQPFRRTAAAGLLVEAASAHAKRLGFRSVRSAIRVTNAESLNIARRQEFNPAGHVRASLLLSRYFLQPPLLRLSSLARRIAEPLRRHLGV